jgi:hypothetical protein
MHTRRAPGRVRALIHTMKMDEETSMATADDGRSPLCQSCNTARPRVIEENGSRSRTTACPHAEADASPLRTEPPLCAASPAAAAATHRAATACRFTRCCRSLDVAGQFLEPRCALASPRWDWEERKRSRERENG